MIDHYSTLAKASEDPSVRRLLRGSLPECQNFREYLEVLEPHAVRIDIDKEMDYIHIRTRLGTATFSAVARRLIIWRHMEWSPKKMEIRRLLVLPGWYWSTNQSDGSDLLPRPLVLKIRLQIAEFWRRRQLELTSYHQGQRAIFGPYWRSQ